MGWLNRVNVFWFLYYQNFVSLWRVPAFLCEWPWVGIYFSYDHALGAWEWSFDLEDQMDSGAISSLWDPWFSGVFHIQRYLKLYTYLYSFGLVDFGHCGFWSLLTWSWFCYTYWLHIDWAVMSSLATVHLTRPASDCYFHFCAVC